MAGSQTPEQREWTIWNCEPHQVEGPPITNPKGITVVSKSQLKAVEQERDAETRRANDALDCFKACIEKRRAAEKRVSQLEGLLREARPWLSSFAADGSCPDCGARPAFKHASNCRVWAKNRGEEVPQDLIDRIDNQLGESDKKLEHQRVCDDLDEARRQASRFDSEAERQQLRAEEAEAELDRVKKEKRECIRAWSQDCSKAEQLRKAIQAENNEARAERDSLREQLAEAVGTLRHYVEMDDGESLARATLAKLGVGE